MVRERVQAVRAGLVTELEGAAKDLAAILETARESDGDRLRCKACGSYWNRPRRGLGDRQ